MGRVLTVLAIMLVMQGARAETSGDVVISPENLGVCISLFFMDYKSRGDAFKISDAELDECFVLDGFNGIRTPIWGNRSKPAHPSHGQVVASCYDDHADVILRAKKRNPGLMVFASKKLDGKTSFPEWTKRVDGSGVEPEAYAAMLADYIEHMKSRGIRIDVLGIDNERAFNEGKIDPERHAKIVDSLRVLSVARGFELPRIIGPEDYGPNENQWMADLINQGWGDRLDIYGTHYYPHRRPLEKLRADLALAGHREKWNTELHWDKKEKDDMVEAEEAICALWDCTDNGMNGLMWWGYSRNGFRGNLMRACSVPLINAWPVAVDDVDGSDISSSGKLHTRAFMKGDQVTVFALNINSDKAYSNMVFRVDSGLIDGDVSVQQWTNVDVAEGTETAIACASDHSFCYPLPDRSISVFSFSWQKEKCESGNEDAASGQLQCKVLCIGDENE